MTASGGGRARPLGSTYRLQISGIGFDGAATVVPYLASLGIETLYLSPVLRAVPGSSHGYDVSDPTLLDPALGGSEAYGRLLDALEAHGMRVLLDIVPNHLAASTDNPWWWDTLRLGQASPHANVFDVDWAVHADRVLLAVLARPLDEILAAGELSVSRDQPEPVLVYGSSRFPLDPTIDDLDTDRRGGLNGLLDRQHYRLAYWRLGPKEGNYRRFFDVEALVGVRVEDVDVYAATHAVVLDLVRDHRVAGFRIDHIDGLADPTAYLQRLRADVDSSRDEPGVLLVEKILARGERLPVAWPVEGTTGYEFADHAFSVLLAPDVPQAVDDPGQIPPGPAAPTRTGAMVAPLEEAAIDAKRQMLRLLFAGQFEALMSSAVAALGPENGHDLARTDIGGALETLVVHLPVYRTYLDGNPLRPEDDALLTGLADDALGRAVGTELERALRALLDGLRRATGPQGDQAWRDVARRFQQLSGALAAKGVEDTALYRTSGLVAGVDVGTPITGTPIGVDAFHRWAGTRAGNDPGSLSTTSTHDAKRSEDVRARLCVLSEMGDRWTDLQHRWDDLPPVRTALDHGGLHPDEVHAAYQMVVGIWPDQPIDEDALRSLRTRIGEYLCKSAREAKLATSWLDPDEEYEARLTGVMEGLLASADSPFAEEVTRLVGMIGPAATTNALALAVLRICVPGVPDTYQGTEVWARLLVDPDNRRSVPFDGLASSLARIDARGRDAASFAALLRSYGDGDVKQAVVSGLLRARRDRPDVFAESGYLPLDIEGDAAAHLVAFARVDAGRPCLLVVVPRLPYLLVGPRRFPLGPTAWENTRLVVPATAAVDWTDVLDGHGIVVSQDRLDVASVLANLPVSVMVPAESA